MRLNSCECWRNYRLSNIQSSPTVSWLLGAFGATTSYLSICQLLRGGDSLHIIDLVTPLFSIAYLVLDGSSYGDPGSWQQDVANACPDTYNANEGLANQDAGIQGFETSCVDLQHLMSDVLFVRTYVVVMAFQVWSTASFFPCPGMARGALRLQRMASGHKSNDTSSNIGLYPRSVLPFAFFLRQL